MSRHNKKGIDIEGIVLLDKGLGQSSNQALQQVKRLFNAKKAGHTGSLDPLASGILPICMGHATKASQFLLNANKRYIANGQLGQQTNTADAEGAVIKTQDYAHITPEDVRHILPDFLGDILQIPPMYSALKKEGKPLYALARSGITVERQPRKITIFELNLLSFHQGCFQIEVLCSKGTYIRTLVEDIANALDNIAFVTQLRRTGFAHYDITQTVRFEALSQAKDRSEFLLPTATIFKDYPNIILDEMQTQAIEYGQNIIYALRDTEENALLKLFTKTQDFIGLGRYDKGIIYPKRLFITQN